MTEQEFLDGYLKAFDEMNLSDKSKINLSILQITRVLERISKKDPEILDLLKLMLFTCDTITQKIEKM